MESAKIGIEWKVSKEKVGKLASRSKMSYVTEEHEEARVFYGLSYAAHLALKSSYIPVLVSVRNTLVTPSTISISFSVLIVITSRAILIHPRRPCSVIA